MIIHTLIYTSLTLCAKWPLPERKGSCAVVFDAGYLKSRNYSNDIDSHDSIWRINARPVHDSLGSRTDVMVVQFASENPAKRIALNNIWNASTIVTFSTDFNTPGKYRSLCNSTSTQWYYVPREKSTTCSNMMKKKCSSGMLSTNLAIKLCDTVSVYGGRSDEEPCYPYRLTADTAPNNKCKHHTLRDHDLMREHKFYKALDYFRVY